MHDTKQEQNQEETEGEAMKETKKKNFAQYGPQDIWRRWFNRKIMLQTPVFSCCRQNRNHHSIQCYPMGNKHL